MKKCPKCGSYLTFNMEYRFGCASVLWTCACGWSSYIETTSASDRTEEYINDNRRFN